MAKRKTARRPAARARVRTAAKRVPLNGSPVASAAPTAQTINRDLSWLEFNRRVLALAQDDRTPLLDRVKFVAIFTTNLDEFFMKRVGLIKRQMSAGIEAPPSAGMSNRDLMAAIREQVTGMQSTLATLYRAELLPALASNGIFVLSYSDLAASEQRWVDDWYRLHVFPALTPLAVDPGHRFPFISNLSDNIGLLVEPPAQARGAAGESLFARVKLLGGTNRFVALPADGRGKKSREHRFVLLHDIIRRHIQDLFPGVGIREQVVFRVTRSAGIQRDELDAANLLQSVEEDIKQRRFARPVRLEVEPGCSTQMLSGLLDKLGLEQSDCYQHPAEEFDSLFEIADIDRPELREKPWKPMVPRAIAQERSGIFAAIRKRDVFLHHPYESFTDSVERFIAQAAADPDVVSIKQTIYRTTPDSPFVESMIRAAEAGKQVACLVELRARFDEDRNVRFARRFEKAGVHTAYGVVGLKTHCKVSLVVRRERQGLRCYAHIGTGNYHSKTAQLYTDVGILTCDPEITSDLVTLFNYLTGISGKQEYKRLLVAPTGMRRGFVERIDREIAAARDGRPARIIAKINSLEDQEMTQKLYDASQAGVPVTLLVRGFCCLRPGVRGLSENVRVLSVVGRFLEHSRIFHFAAGSKDPLEGDWLIGSADWMHRNLNTRVEACCPITDPHSRGRLHRILEASILDQRNAWELRPDGTYVQRKPPPDAGPNDPRTLGTFATLMRDAMKG